MSSGEGPRPKLLYVEDQDPNWEVASLRLAARFDLIWARNAREACAAIVEHGAELKGVLMDIQLQGSELNGMELARLFRGRLEAERMPEFARRCPPVAVPIFFLTAYGDQVTPTDVTDCGASGLVAKPVDFGKLHHTLSRLDEQGPGEGRD